MRQVFYLADRIVVFRRGRICADPDIKADICTGKDGVACLTGIKTQGGDKDAA